MCRDSDSESLDELTAFWLLCPFALLGFSESPDDKSSQHFSLQLEHCVATS